MTKTAEKLVQDLNSREATLNKGTDPKDWLASIGENPDDWNIEPSAIGWWETKSKEDDEPIVLERAGFKFERKAEKLIDFREMEWWQKELNKRTKAKYATRGKRSAYAEGSGWGDQQLQKVDVRGGSETSISHWQEAREVRSEEWAKRKPETSFHVNGGDIFEGHATGSAKTGMLDMGMLEAMPIAFRERVADVEAAWRLTSGVHYDLTHTANHDELRSPAGAHIGRASNDASIALSKMVEFYFASQGIGREQGLVFIRPEDDFSDYCVLPDLFIMSMHGHRARGKFGAEQWLANQPKLAKTTTAFTAHYHNGQHRSWGINPFSGAERSLIQLPALEPSSSWIEQLDGRAVNRPGLWLGALDEEGAVVPLTAGFIPVGDKPKAVLS